MNVKLKVLTVGARFFIGGQAVMAQKKKDSLGEKKIEEVVWSRVLAIPNLNVLF